MNGRFTHRRIKKDNKKRIDHHKNRMGKMLTCLVFCVIVVNIEAQAAEYRYDALGRLQYVQYENGDIVRYSYDANGNMQTYKYQAEKREDSEDKKEEDKPGSGDKKEENKEENKPGSGDEGSGGNGGSDNNGGNEDSGESGDEKEENKPGSGNEEEDGKTDGGDSGNEEDGKTDGGDSGNEEDGKTDGGDTGDKEEEGKTDTGNAAGSDNSGKEVENNNREDSKEEQTDIGNKDDEDSGIQREDSHSGKPVVAQEPVREGDIFRTGTAVYQVTGIGKTKTVSFKRLTDKKAKSFKIPSMVKIKGKKYNVTKIASGAFQNRTKLTQVTVGVNVTGIGSKAFYGCKNLKKIIITSKKLKTAGVNAFRGISKKATIRVPRSRYKNYKKILNGKGQAKSVRIVQDK